MMDWADEIAMAFLDNLDCSELDIVEGPDAPFQRLGALIRKAKADGMREAAELLGTLTYGSYAKELYARAAEIEKGNA